jgi:hypothetical protein
MNAPDDSDLAPLFVGAHTEEANAIGFDAASENCAWVAQYLEWCGGASSKAESCVVVGTARSTPAFLSKLCRVRAS